MSDKRPDEEKTILETTPEELRAGYERTKAEREAEIAEAKLARDQEYEGVADQFSKRELWDALQRFKRGDQRRLDQRIERGWDRMQHQNEELHGTLCTLLAGTADSMKDLSEATASMLRRGRDKEISLCFPIGDGENGGEFRLHCSLDALKDPDVRDALAKGRAILEGMLPRGPSGG